jgi:hypothetical protein
LQVLEQVVVASHWPLDEQRSPDLQATQLLPPTPQAAAVGGSTHWSADEQHPAAQLEEPQVEPPVHDPF